MSFAGEGDFTGQLPRAGAPRLAFWFCYDHLGKLLLLNLIVLLPVLVVAVMLFVMGADKPIIPIVPGLLVSAAWLGVGMAGLLRVVARAVAEGEMRLGPGLSFASLAGGALGGLLALGVVWAFVNGAVLYGSGFLPLPRPVGLILSGLTLGTGLLVLHLLLWCGAGCFVHVGSWTEKLRASLLAIILLPGEWLTVWVLSLLWAMIATLLWPLVVIWSAAPIAVLLVAGHARYSVWNPPFGSISTNTALQENRTIRDFWFPWKN